MGHSVVHARVTSQSACKGPIRSDAAPVRLGATTLAEPGRSLVNHPQLHWIANFIWGIADDVLRDL